MRASRFRDLDLNVLIPVLLLSLLSLKLIYELYGLQRAFLQAVWFGLSAAVLLVVLSVDYRSLTRISVFLYPLLLLALGAVLFTSPINGARSWFRFGRISIQPSEFAKPAMILVLAAWLPFRDSFKRFTGLLPPLLFTLVPFGLVILQPDLGTAALYVPLFLVVVLTAGARLRHILFLFLIAIALSPVFYANLADHQKRRIQAFLNPERFSTSTSLHLERAKIALGAGGLTGFTPEGEDAAPHMSFLTYAGSDYAFAVVGEMFGLVGTAGVLLLLLWLFYGLYALFLRIRDPVGRLIIAGAFAVLASQAFLHIGGNLHLVPFTGVPLPFLSYGGSSLMSSMICIGLALNVGLRRRLTFGDEGAPPDSSGTAGD